VQRLALSQQFLVGAHPIGILAKVTRHTRMAVRPPSAPTPLRMALRPPRCGTNPKAVARGLANVSPI
jgi:hypothetical protein